MLDVEFYRLYNGLWACDLMPCLCRDFCDFHKSLPCFFAIFCRHFLLSLCMYTNADLGITYQQWVTLLWRVKILGKLTAGTNQVFLDSRQKLLQNVTVMFLESEKLRKTRNEKSCTSSNGKLDEYSNHKNIQNKKTLKNAEMNFVGSHIPSQNLVVQSAKFGEGILKHDQAIAIGSFLVRSLWPWTMTLTSHHCLQ